MSHKKEKEREGEKGIQRESRAEKEKEAPKANSYGITVIEGQMGSGMSYTAIAYTIDSLLDKSKNKKMIFIDHEVELPTMYKVRKNEREK